MMCAKSVTTKLGNEKTEIREWECSLNCEDPHKSSQQKLRDCTETTERSEPREQ